MPCFFCIATVALISGSVGVSAIEGVRAGLQQLAKGEVKVTDDTPSTQRLELDVAVPRATARTRSEARDSPAPAPSTVPVAVTVYKKHARVRVQVLTHDVDRAQAEAVQDAVLAAAGLTLVHRSDHQEQAIVHDAMDRLGHAQEPAGTERLAWQEER